jgi:hypothetical protein
MKNWKPWSVWRRISSGGEGWAAEEFAVAPAGLDHPGDGGVEFGVVLGAAQAEGEREVAGADEQDVESGGGGDGFDVLHAVGVLDHRDDEHFAVGEVVIPLGGRPAELGEAGAGAAEAEGRVAAGGDRLAGEFGGAG